MRRFVSKVVSSNMAYLYFAIFRKICGTAHIIVQEQFVSVERQVLYFFVQILRFRNTSQVICNPSTLVLKISDISLQALLKMC